MKSDTDKVLGAIYGQAIGDALGLPVEFKSAKVIAGYRKDDPNEWPSIYRATNRRGGVEVWKAGEWSDDTEQALCILDAYLQGLQEGRDPAEQVDLLIVADHFVRWAQTNGRGMGNHTWKVLSDALFLLEPKEVGLQVWEQSGRQAAPNGAVMRTAYVGVLHPWDLPWTAKVAADVAATTHADPRCLASAVAVSVAVACLVTGKEIPEAIRMANAMAARHDPDFRPWLSKSLEELKLDEGLDAPRSEKMPPIGYTYKCLGAAFWALNECQRLWDGRMRKGPKMFEAALLPVIYAGGDTDTNGAVAGALVGAYLGRSNLPPKYVAGLTPGSELQRRAEMLLDVHARA